MKLVFFLCGFALFFSQASFSKDNFQRNEYNLGGILDATKIDANNDSIEDFILAANQITVENSDQTYVIASNLDEIQCKAHVNSDPKETKLLILHGQSREVHHLSQAHLILPCVGDFHGAKYGMSFISQQALSKSLGYDLVSDPNQMLVVIPTEAGIDTYLYWTGERYQLFYPPEEP
ncbi:hypothetical protein [Vibrio vulnificus]|uniref:hypothetical protein n=1 Tax=Vibrio vulnificus TaxID=672 RepID=UPI001CDBBFB2|nr:hypothetical protein [Vibrio vulnificus]MCA3953106.1 hypothetical protein [Vibrio vulnificus]